MSLIGASIRRVEDPVLLAGRGSFLDDVRIAPPPLEVAFVRSPHAHARIVRVDVERTRTAAGVACVLTGAETAQLVAGWRGVLAYPGMKAGLQRPLAVEKVRFVGEPMVAIAATSRALAEDAADLVEIDYAPLPPVVDAGAALQPDSPLVHEDLGDNLSWRNVYQTGDVDAVLAAADLVITRVFRTGRHTGVPKAPPTCCAITRTWWSSRPSSAA
jgi:carbon-monoxide dehydrogenase large subunit